MDVLRDQYFNWDITRPYLGDLLRGFWITIQITFLAQIMAMSLGLVIALMRRFRVRSTTRPARFGAGVVRWLAIAYTDVFRGLPSLLVIVLFYGSFPYLPVPILPGLTGFQVAFFALGVVYAAYLAEVYRAGIESIERGQIEAARSLGMSSFACTRHVILPQAIRRVLPPLMNDFIALSKDVALAGVIAVPEVVLVAKDAQSVQFNSSFLIAAGVFYLIFTLPAIRIFDRYVDRERRRVGGGEVVIP
jgi:polar amino acid transport system permease protein